MIGVMDNIIINGAHVFRNNASVSWQNPISPIFEVIKGDIVSFSGKAQAVTGKFYYIR